MIMILEPYICAVTNFSFCAFYQHVHWLKLDKSDDYDTSLKP